MNFKYKCIIQKLYPMSYIFNILFIQQISEGPSYVLNMLLLFTCFDLCHNSNALAF